MNVQTTNTNRRDGIDRALRWGLVVVVVGAVGALAAGTVSTYRAAPPIPERVTDESGTVLFTRANISSGRAIFQRADLMDFGSLYGNGAYLGPDWGDDYLARELIVLRARTAMDSFGRRYDTLSTEQRQVVDRDIGTELKINRFSEVTKTLVMTKDQTAAYEQIRSYYRTLFTQGSRAFGLPPDVVTSSAESDDLTSFLGWIAWTSTAERPGTSTSYTNNWPYEPGTDNQATGSMWLWTWVSLGLAIVLGGAAWWFYRHHLTRGTHYSEPEVSVDESPVTASQSATWKWFLIVPVLLLLQGLVGVVLAHYYADRSSFFGIDIRSALPFTALKAGHLQLAIAWIAAAWMGIGLFLAPLVGRREPRRQRLLADALWATVVLVVVGALVGLYLGVTGRTGGAWRWLGNQGLEYIQLGRMFQIALLAGLFIWAAIVLRAFWPGLKARRWGSLEGLLLYSGVAIGGVYAFGMLSGMSSSATLSDYWRWFVVHLWVENVFEFFTVAVIGYALLSMGLLSRRLVERVVYFELILIFGSGILGMGHHFYWAGEPSAWIGVGSVFSMLEVVPLVLMMARAWKEYRIVRAARGSFPQRAAFMFFTSAAVWNLVGAGILGGILNPPILSYYEHGTFLTLAHGHASMFGVFGLLALGLVYMGTRGLVQRDRWSDTKPLWVLRLFNASIVLWLALNLLPIGVAQFVASVDHGFAYARSTTFYEDWTLFQWLRMVGDAAYLGAGALMLLDLWQKFRGRRPPAVVAVEPFVIPPALGEAPRAERPIVPV